jgi:hypothetical protein
MRIIRLTLVVASLCTCVSLTCMGAPLLSETLGRDAERLIADGDTASLFTPADKATLRGLLRRSDDSVGIDRVLSSRAPIDVTINPEARVSARRTVAKMPKLVCGLPASLLIRIVNEALVTSALRARLPDAAMSSMVSIQPIQPRLAGASLEYRVLKLSLMHRGDTDITLTFDAGPGTEDLGNRATLSLLTRCVSP